MKRGNRVWGRGTYGYAWEELDQGMDEGLADAVWFCEVCAFLAVRLFSLLVSR